MNALVTLNGGEAVTTTLAIAEGTELDHASVILLVRKYLDDLKEFGLVDFKSESTGGRPTEYATLNEQQSTLILTYMRNSDIVRGFKKRLVKAFWELARRGEKIDYTKLSTIQILEIAMKAEQERLVLEHKVEELAPKAQALDRIATQTEGAVNLRIAAKLLQVPEKQFLQFANAKGFIFRNHFSHTWQGYADKSKAGLVELKLTRVERDDGSEKTVEQVLITRPGLAKLAQLLGVNLPPNGSTGGMPA